MSLRPLSVEPLLTFGLLFADGKYLEEAEYRKVEA